ncbi:hypothetical protein Mal4_51790 [Maioricimonas rarisocia]|uniref:Uncharacterized protein n=1 Tax=Maioricimonas rarisocia TaxID=2528026 RepID=A0A517ZEA7_9PLAN|nr:hypothetical protein [Maioricimonas rarisocia]QDU40817.1 hypothetical protein Mal4_51790 [Maioricimonas rarisocia]
MYFRLRGRSALLAAVLAIPTMAAPVAAADCAPFGTGNNYYTHPHATPGYCPPGTPAAPPTEPPMAPGDKPMTDPMADPMGDQPQDQQQQPQAQQPQQQPQLAQPTFTPSAPTTAASSPSSLAPNMIGDFFGAGGSQAVIPYIQFGFPGNPATPLAPLGPDVRFNVSAGPGSTTVYSVDSLAAINADPNVDMVGNQFDLQENSDITSAVQSLTGLPLVFIHSDATLVSNDTLNPGVSLFDAYNLDASYGYIVDVPNPSAGGSVGRQKIGENTSPMPRDRVFFNYSFFENTNLARGGPNVHRFTPGFEKTFLDGDMSFELRTPFASTVGSDVIAGGAVNDDEVEFGNLTMYLKALLFETQTAALSAGLGVAVPTASDASVKLPNGQRLVGIENNSVHLLPFIGGLYTPSERFFAQGFLQLDVDANGNAVYADPDGMGLRKIGTAQDQTYLFLDLAVGYWVYLNPNSSGHLRGLAPTLEMHYNAALTSTDVVRSGGLQVGRDAGDVQLVNGVVGMTALLGQGSTLTAGYAVPLGGGNDQQFDGELRVMLNVFFGGSRDRLRRAQF